MQPGTPQWASAGRDLGQAEMVTIHEPSNDVGAQYGSHAAVTRERLQSAPHAATGESHSCHGTHSSLLGTED
jgi:hypothetical protein